MFRQAPPSTYFVIIEDIPVDPPAEQPQRQVVQQIEPLQQEDQVSEVALLHPCVICLVAEATFIALFCCHLLACFECMQALRVNGVGNCPICQEPAIYFYEFICYKGNFNLFSSSVVSIFYLYFFWGF